MQLRRLAALERKKIEDEYNELMKKIKEIIFMLMHPAKVLETIKTELDSLAVEYGDDRKTKVVKSPVGTFSEEDLVASEETIVTLTKTGYIKRMPLNTFRSQRRGGKGVAGMTVKETDEVNLITSANTHDYLLVFTNKGRVFSLKVWELPEGSRIAKGQAIVNLINIDSDETVQSILPLSSEASKLKNSYLFFTTRNGVVKRTVMEKYSNIKSNGLIAIKLTDNDQLVWVHETSGSNDIFLVSHEGKSIRFKETDVRPTDRDTMGVRGILLKKEDYVITMAVISSVGARRDAPSPKNRRAFSDLLIVTECGMGKRTAIDQYAVQNRGGQGMKVSDITAKTGKVASAQLVDENSDELLITTSAAQAIKLPIKNIPRLSRDTQGVILMRFAKAGDSVCAVTCLDKPSDPSLREGIPTKQSI